MRKTLTKMLLILSAVTLLLSVSACGEKVKAISVDLGSGVKVVYNVGEDLNLSTGSITVDNGKTSTTVALNDGGVSVSGYNKNTAGTQTLTVTYSGKTATYTVTVLQPATAERYTQYYFVGAPFDTSAGRLKTYGADGKTSYTNFSSKNVTITGFDSTTAGEKTVTATLNKDGLTTSATFKVKVYAVDRIEVSTKPNKTTYQTYDTEIDVTGGIITVYGQNDEVSKEMPMTADMLSGFNPSALTEDDYGSPVTQTVNVDYNGVKSNFNVTVNYSSVTLIQKILGEITDDFDVTEEEGYGLDGDQSSRAVLMAQLYHGLRPVEKTYFTTEQKTVIFQASAVCGLAEWKTESAKYSDTVEFVKETATFTGTSYEKVNEVVQALSDGNNRLVELAGILSNARVDGKEVIITEETTVEKYLENIPTVSSLTANLEVIKYMVEVYELLEDVPDDWTRESLDTYKTQIESVIEFVANSNYYGNTNLRFIYGSLSKWRTNNDYFDIVYNYYYTIHLQGLEETDTDKQKQAEDKIDNALKVLVSLCLPTELEEVYGYLCSTVQECASAESGAAMDTTNFMYYFTKLFEKANDALDDENANHDFNLYYYRKVQLHGFLQNSVTGEDIASSFPQLLNYVRSNVYFKLTYYYLTEEATEDVLDKFMDFIDAYYEQGGEYLDGDDCLTALKAVFDAYVSLTPMQQYAFNCSMYTMYSVEDYEDIYVFSELVNEKDEEKIEYYTMLASLLYYCYDNQLEDDGAKQVFRDLLFAMENYARVPFDDNAVSLFIEKMEKTTEGYEKLTGDAKTAFDDLLKTAYDKYLGIYNLYDAETATVKAKTDISTLTPDQQEILNALIESIRKIKKYVEDEEYFAAFAEYYNFDSIVKQLYEADDQTLLDIFYTESLDVVGLEEDERERTLDEHVMLVRGLFSNLIISNQYTVKNGSTYLLYDLLNDEYGEFLSNSAYLYGIYFAIPEDDTTGVKYFDLTEILSVMSDLRDMEIYNQALMYSMGGDTYINVIAKAFKEEYGTTVSDVVDKLLKVEKYYVLYKDTPTKTFKFEDETSEEEVQEGDEDEEDYVIKTVLELLQESYEELVTAYEGLETADKTAFDTDLQTVYDYYVTACNEIEGFTTAE